MIITFLQSQGGKAMMNNSINTLHCYFDNREDHQVK